MRKMVNIVATKNLTVTLGEGDANDLDFLVEYYQRESISTVNKTDVIKFMIRQTKKSIEVKEGTE